MGVLISEHKHATAIRAGRTPFADVLRESDVVTLHCPLTDQTFDLFGRAELEMMKRDALLIKYTPEWFEVKEIDAQIKPLEGELEKEPFNILATMKAKYEAALATENRLRQSYNQQKATTSGQTRDQIEMASYGPHGVEVIDIRRDRFGELLLRLMLQGLKLADAEARQLPNTAPL